MSTFTKPTSAADLAEFEALAGLATSAVKPTAGLARWERKKASGLKQYSGGSSSDQSVKQDRFIPNRGTTDMVNAGASLFGADNAALAAAGAAGGENSDYRSMLEKSLLGTSSSSASSSSMNEPSEYRVLSFKDKAPVSAETSVRQEVLYSSNKACADKPTKAGKSMRQIPSAPSRILDAPDLLDDYYLNLISWSSENVIAVALGPAVYLWNAKTGTIEELMALENENDYVCSLEWIPGGSHLAVGTAGCETQLWDATALKQVRSMNGHSDRVSSLAWNQHTLTSGSKDSTIVNHDVRVQNHHTATLAGHTQEVCGLKWSPDGSQLASGGNDNLLCIWDAAASASSSGPSGGRTQQPKFSLGEHQAAVKALAWSPHERNLVASGGGTADRCIKFWNTQTGSRLNSIDTGSQVCSLLWNPHEKEILSSHGFAKNELCLWKYPSMLKVKELTGHTARVLHLASAPGGSQVVSAGADETLRFWDVFGEAPEAKKAKSGILSTAAIGKTKGFSSMSIR
jgi:cell division cycle protein 20 (cofactor of APC complex)